MYELCATGTPTITYSFADNQLDNVRQFAEDGIMRYAGDIRQGDIYNYIKKYIQLYDDRDCRYHISKKMSAIIDGDGANRIAKRL